MFPPQGLVKAVDTRVATVIVAADGSGDYTDIQEGINALPASGGVVYIKEGLYEIDSTIYINKNNVSLIGAGFNTIIKGADGASVDAMVDISYQYCIVSNLAIDGNKINNGSGDGIGVFEYYNTVENCYIHDTGLSGIDAWAADYCKTMNNIIDNAGTATSNAGIVYGDSSFGTISGNIVLNSYDYGIWISTSFGVICTDNVVINTTVGPGIGLIISTSDSVAANNYVENAADDGIFIEALSHVTDNNIVEGNIVKNCGGWGINMAYSPPNASLDRTIVVNNRLINNTSGGIRDTGTNTQIAHNIE